MLCDSVDGDYRRLHAEGPVKIVASLNDFVDSKGHISLKDEAVAAAPEHTPVEIQAPFDEGAKCVAVGCFNAAGTMFRLCIDLATCTKLPLSDEDGLNQGVRRSLGRRLQWLLDRGLIPESLRELSTAVKEDGNDGAHAGALTEQDAEDLLDFTVALLERLYTEPEKLRLAKTRREERRKRP